MAESKNEPNVSKQVEELQKQIADQKAANEELQKQLQHADKASPETAQMQEEIARLKRQLEKATGDIQVVTPEFKTQVIRNGETIGVELRSYECECVSAPAGRAKLPSQIIVDVPDPSEARRQYLAKVGPRTSKYTVHIHEVPRPKTDGKKQKSTSA